MIVQLERIDPVTLANGFVEYSERSVAAASEAYRKDKLLSGSYS